MMFPSGEANMEVILDTRPLAATRRGRKAHIAPRLGQAAVLELAFVDHHAVLAV